MKVYKSEISMPLALSIFGTLTFVLIIALIQTAWPAVAIVSLFLLFFFHLFTTTQYAISPDGYLLVQSSFIYRKKIAITSIRKVQATSNPLSSPALSLHRLNVFFGQTSVVTISPKQREAFIADLQKHQPNIEVQL